MPSVPWPSRITGFRFMYRHMRRPIKMLLDPVFLCPVDHPVIVPAGVHDIHIDVRSVITVTPHPNDRAAKVIRSAGASRLQGSDVPDVCATHEPLADAVDAVRQVVV